MKLFERPNKAVTDETLSPTARLVAFDAMVEQIPAAIAAAEADFDPSEVLRLRFIDERKDALRARLVRECAEAEFVDLHLAIDWQNALIAQHDAKLGELMAAEVRARDARVEFERTTVEPARGSVSMAWSRINELQREHHHELRYDELLEARGGYDKVVAAARKARGFK